MAIVAGMDEPVAGAVAWDANPWPPGAGHAEPGHGVGGHGACQTGGRTLPLGMRVPSVERRLRRLLAHLSVTFQVLWQSLLPLSRQIRPRRES